MIDKLKEFEELSYSIGDFHDTSKESEQRLEQLRKEINQSIKLEELLKEKIKDIDFDCALAHQQHPLEDMRDEESKLELLESLEEESEKSGNNTFITNKQKDT